MLSNGSETSRFLRACRRQPVDATPVWLMRQAGRYMPEYRKLREKWGILEIIKNPELAVEVTMQPVEAFDLDAAIIFADILPVLEPMGLSLEFVKGEIWANVWHTDRIARIDPKTGRVNSWIDLSGLMGMYRLDAEAVLNGIAEDPATGRLFVTGKLWPRLFEIQVVPKAAARTRGGKER